MIYGVDLMPAVLFETRVCRPCCQGRLNGQRAIRSVIVGLPDKEQNTNKNRMKKIITPGVREESETVCDATGKPAVAGLVMYFCYGSSHDGRRLQVDLCDEVAEDILKFLQSKYPQFKLDDRDFLMHCPLCERHA